jgi:hypothetical protein
MLEEEKAAVVESESEKIQDLELEKDEKTRRQARAIPQQPH